MQPTMQPEMTFDPPLPPVEPKVEPKVRNRMLRYPIWLDPLVKQAAEREGLSVNQWIVRVISEFAKRSERDDWQSSSPASAPLAEGRAPLGGRVADAFIAKNAKLTLHNSQNPVTGTVTWSRLVTGDGCPVEVFDPPDDDIPSLQ